MKESEAKTKICPMMTSPVNYPSGEVGLVPTGCMGAACAVWDARRKPLVFREGEDREYVNIHGVHTVHSKQVYRGHPFWNNMPEEERAKYDEPEPEGQCGLITKEPN